MKILWNPALILGLFVWIPVTYSYSSQAPEDQDTSGDDEESSGSGMAENEPSWVTDAPVMSTEQTTRVPVTTASYSTLLTTSISSVDVFPVEETTAVSLVYPENTTILFEKGFVAEDYTTKAVVKVDNIPTVSVKVTDKSTRVPHVETVPVQMTKKDVDVMNPEPEATTKSINVFMTTEGRNVIVMFNDNVVPEDRNKVGNSGIDSDFDNDFEFDNEIKPRKVVPVNEPGAIGASSGEDSLLERKEVLACVIAGGVVALIFSGMLVSLMVYRMKKKDEGSYALQDMPQPYVYQKAQKQEEFFA